MRAIRLFLGALGACVASGVVSGAAWASPVVGPGGKPGAAAAWTGNGTTVTLSIAKGFDAKAVADAIQKGVAGTSATAQGDKVVVNGLAQDALLSKLEKVEVA